MSPLALDPIFLAVLRVALALLLLSAALHKLRDLPAFVGVLADYRLLPPATLPPTARGIACAEAVAALALVTPGTGPAPALATAGLLALYAGAIAVNLARGRRFVACGCAGPAGDQRLHGGLVLRNAVLVFAALVAALPVAGRTLVWVDALSLLGGVAGAALAYAAADVALANASRLRTLRGAP